jgi:hypothetical protein
MRRAVDCRCADHFEARNDSELLDMFRRHVEAEHPEWGEADIKAHLVSNAYDQVPEGSRA